MKTADFNKDGRQDLALAAGANVFVLLNTLNAIEVIPLVNGTFDAGLDGWTAETTPAGVIGGSVQAIGGAAVFQEGNAGRVTLSQRLVIPAGATALSFDLVDNGLDPAVPGFLPDTFEVSGGTIPFSSIVWLSAVTVSGAFVMSAEAGATDVRL